MTFVPTSKDEVLEKVDLAYLQSITDNGTPGEVSQIPNIEI